MRYVHQKEVFIPREWEFLLRDKAIRELLRLAIRDGVITSEILRLIPRDIRFDPLLCQETVKLLLIAMYPNLEVEIQEASTKKKKRPSAEIVSGSEESAVLIENDGIDNEDAALEIYEEGQETYIADGDEESDNEPAQEHSKTNVALYLNEMCKWSLLSRKKEIKLFREYEERKKTVFKILLGFPAIRAELEKKLHAMLAAIEKRDAKLQSAEEQENEVQENEEEPESLSLAVIKSVLRRLRRSGRKLAMLERRFSLLSQPRKRNAKVRIAKKRAFQCAIERQCGKLANALHETGINLMDLGLHKFIRQACSLPSPTEFLRWRTEWLKFEEKRMIRVRNDIVKPNLRLVVWVAKNHPHPSLTLLDRINEGNLGLMKAVDKFEYRRGYTFSTYATWWIYQAITRAFSNTGSTIRIPVHIWVRRGKLFAASRKLAHIHGRKPTIDELASFLNWTDEEVRKMLTIAEEPLSMEEPVSHDEDAFELGDFISDTTIPSPVDSVLESSTEEKVRLALSKLPPRLRFVVSKRFGIGYDRWYTLEEVGKELKFTRELIRQNQEQALKKLRIIMQRMGLNSKSFFGN